MPELTPRLPKRLHDALHDCEAFGGLYYWRRDSMRRLRQAGLVETDPRDLRAFRLTLAGGAYCKEHPRDE